MTETELAICSRVQRIREHLNWPQPAFAGELDISRDKLASIEYGRTPLRYDLGRRICDRFNLSIAWLVAGLGKQDNFIPIAEELNSKIPAKTLASEAFERFIRPNLGAIYQRYLKEGKTTGITLQLTSPVGLPNDRFREWMVLQEVRRAIKRVPAESQPAFSLALSKAIESFGLNHSLDLGQGSKLHPEKQKILAAGQKPGLTQTSTFRNTSDVKLTLKGLMDKVRKLTAPAGMKTKLAADLKVPTSRVSEWLSGKHDPSGEVTLQLLQWVQQQEQTK